MAKRNKLVHIHSNVYTNGAPQAPQSGVLNKGEIAVNYNDTEPALFIENNSGQIVKFNAITKEKIGTIEGNISNLESNLSDVQSNNKITLNGTQKSMTGSTWSFYAPTASGAAETVLVSDGANKSPKWVAQSALTVGNASEAGKTTGGLTIKTNGTQKAVFNGSADTTVNITATDVGAAASSHNHEAGDLPTGSTSEYGILKLGTAAGTAAQGNHSHSAYVNPTVTNCAATLSWGTSATVATIGSTAITVTPMSKPTPADIGAAASSHNHEAGDLPTAATNAYGVMKVGTSLGVSNGVVNASTATTSVYGVVKPGSGLGVSNGVITVNTATTDGYGVVKAGNFIGINASGVISAKTGTTSSTLARGDHSHTPASIGAATENHNHDAADLPTATTNDYGIVRLGTGSGDAAVGNHTHASYVNPTVTNCGETLSWGSEAVVGKIGSTSLTVKAMAKPTASEIGAAASSHSHEAGDLPTASTSAYGVMKVGSSLSATDGVVSVNTASSSTFGVMKVGTGLGVSNGVVNVSTAGTSTYGVMKGGNFVNVTSGGVISVATGTSSSTVARGDHSHTAAQVGAAPASHTHDAADLPTASTTDYGIIKIGTDATDAAAGNHTHSAYVNPTVTNCGQTLSWGSEAVVGKIGSTSLTVKAMAKPTASEIGAAASSHSHEAGDLPTGSTSAYGILKLGTAAGTAAQGNHTHSAYVNPTVTDCAQTLSWGTQITAATIGTTPITLTAMAKPTASEIGAAASSHSHEAGDLPTASTSAYGVMKVGTSLGVSNGVVNASTATTSAFGVVKVGSGLGVSNGTISVNTAGTSTYGVMKAGNFVSVTSAGVISVSTGTSSTTVARGDHSHTAAQVGAAPASHTHDAADLPTGSTSEYGVLKLGTTSADAAAGNHTHSAYVNPTVTNCAQTLSWGTQVTAATIGSSAITIKAMAKPTPGDIGAAASSHSHEAADLPTGSTSAYGVLKLGTGASEAAQGNHTHSAYVNPTVTNCAQTLSWGTQVTAATIGSSAITIKAMSKPTPGDIGAAPSSHSHAIGDLPYETSIPASGADNTKLITTKGVKDYVDGLVASPVNYKGAQTNGSVPASATSKVGDMYIVQTSAISLTSATSATGAAQTAEVGDYIICRSAGKWDVIQKNLTGAVTAGEGLTADYFVLGNGNQTIKKSTYNANSFAPASHSHTAADLPTASTSVYGIIKVGSGATDAAAGNHTHSAYVNPTVTNCAQTLSWDTTVTAATIGSTALTIKAMAKPTPGDIGAAASSHSHGAGDLPTAATNAYGVMKVGTGLGVSNGVVNAATASTSAYGIIKVGSGLGVSNGVVNVSTASTDTYGVVKAGNFVNVSTAGVITVATGTSSSTVARGDHSHTAAQVGAAPASHSHTVADLPTGSTSAYGVLKLGTGAAEAAQGNHTHSAYVNPTVTNCAQTLSWDTTVTAATIGSTALTIKAMTKPTPADIGAAPSSHSHTAGDLPTGSTSAYGILKLGTAAGTAAQGNHTHSAYVNPTVTDCAQTLTWDTTVTAATIGSTALTIKAMAKPTPSDIGAAASSHSHSAGDLPTAATNAYGVMKVGTSLSVSNGVVNASTATTSAFGVVKVGSGLGVSNGTISVNTAGSATYGVVKAGSFITISTAGVITVATGTSSTTVARGDHSHTAAQVGAAPASHSHTAADLPTASTSAYGIIKVGSGAADAAAGNHTHSAYVNPTVTNCAQTLSWDTTVTAATIGSTALTIKAMAKPTPADIGAAISSHSHTAGDLPTAATNAYGVMKVGTSLSVSNGVVNAATATTSAFGVVKIGTSLGVSNGVVNAATATTSAFGVIKPGTFMSITNGVLTISTGTSSTTIARGDHTHSLSSLGAAPSSHGHEASDINGTVSDSDKVDGYHVSVVTSMPSTPDANTIYILK